MFSASGSTVVVDCDMAESKDRAVAPDCRTLESDRVIKVAERAGRSASWPHCLPRPLAGNLLYSCQGGLPQALLPVYFP